MTTIHTMKRRVVGALLSGGVAVAGFGLAAGTAQAEIGLAPPSHGPVLAASGPNQWGSGQIADAPPPPPPPVPNGPPPPPKICWALFLPAPCPPGRR
jgi:hypothetical protein